MAKLAMRLLSEYVKRAAELESMTSLARRKLKNAVSLLPAPTAVAARSVVPPTADGNSATLRRSNDQPRAAPPDETVGTAAGTVEAEGTVPVGVADSTRSGPSS